MINARSQTTQAFLDSVGFGGQPLARETFIMTRYPYTYAYDFVLAEAGSKPMSRSDVAHELRVFVKNDEAAAHQICVELANAYCANHGMTVPR